MALRETPHQADADLFRLELVNMIDLRHDLCALAAKIDWKALEARFGGLYAAGVGRPGHPIRLMVGLQLLKHIRDESDEDIVRAWVENPYFQYFCGEQYFRHDLPIDPSLMTGFRQRIGTEGCEFILALTVQTGLATKTITASSLGVVNVDTTVQEKAVAFPTDAKLLNKARIKVVRLAKRCGILLRQPYTFKGQEAFVQAARYAHARQFNRAQAQTSKLRTMLGRVIRDTERKAKGMQLDPRLHAHLAQLLQIASRIHSQPRVRAEGDPPKVYSVHAPQVECISKGKAHKQYEFGVKVGIVTTSKESFVLAAKSLPGNPYDGHTLKACLDQAQRTSGVAASQVFVDRGYKGHGCNTNQRQVFISGAKRGITPSLKRKLKRRNAIEPVIGHMKSDTRLSRNFLKGVQGDAINALLSAAAHNLRKILKKLRLLCAQWGIGWLELITELRIQRAFA
ncbi:MAG: IS5 family transposase [Brachymonas sp.]